MAILGKIGQALGQIGRYYTSPEGLQTAQAMLMDYANPGAGAYMALQSRRAKLAQQQQQQKALEDWVNSAQIDTTTPQVNELVAQANQDGRGRFNPMPFGQVKPPNYNTPQSQKAMIRALGAGVPLSDMTALQEAFNPKPNLQAITSGGRTGTFNRDTGEFEMSDPDPLSQELLKAQIAALQATAGQRTAQGNAAIINANRPRGGGGGGGGAMTPRPKGGPVRVLTF